MKLAFLLITSALVFACASTQLKDLVIKDTFKQPESVYFNSADDHIYISNVNGKGNEKNGQGFISKLNKDGKILDFKWVTGLNAPKGSRAHNNILWVSDIDEVVKIDMKKATILKRFKVKGAKFLNDIAVNSRGDVYVSDSLGSKIYRIVNGRVSLFAKGSYLESPNGLLFKNDKLFVAAWGLTTDWSTTKVGRLYQIDLKTKKITYLTSKPLGNLDGIELTANGDFIVSDYMGGKVFEVSAKSGESRLVYQGVKSLADIGYISSINRLLVPYLGSSTVILTTLK